MATQLAKLNFIKTDIFSLKVCVGLKGSVRIRVTWKAPTQDLQ